MPNNTKDKEKDKNTKLITDYIEIEQNTLIRSSSILSPLEQSQQQKKANIQANYTPQNPKSMNMNDNDDQDRESNAMNLADAMQIAIKDAIAPILSEIQLLRETVHSDYKRLHTDYTELKDSITSKSNEVAESLTKKIEANTEKIMQVMVENQSLHKENASLKE